MHAVRRTIGTHSFGLLAALWVLSGCGDNPSRPCDLRPYSAPTLVGELYDYCFSGADRTGDTLSVLLHLDTANLPSHNAGISKLVLSSQRTHPHSGGDRLEYFFRGTLPDSIDPGVAMEIGWKVAIPAAEVRYCETCFTQCGLAPIIYLHGDLEGLTLLYDPADTVGIFIRLVE